MSPPSVLVVTTSYPTVDAPVAGVFVREHARAAAPYARLGILHLERTVGLRGLRVERDEDEVGPIWRVRFPHAPRPVSLAGLGAAAAVGLRSARRDGFRPDLLHAHFVTAAVPAVALAALTRTPVVVSEHWSAFLPEDPFELRGPLLALSRGALERAAIVLPVSEALARGLAAYGIHARTRVLPNAVDESLFYPPTPRRPPQDPLRVLSVALFYAAKGVDLLVEAVGLLRARGRELRLDLVGDGEMRPQLERLVARRGLDDIVRFHGILPKRDVAERMRAADIFVLSSRFDNNPVALLEALVSGLPAVATAVGGVPELIDDERLLASPDPEDLASCIEAAIAVARVADRAERAASAAARFGSRQIGRELGEIYSDILRR